MSFWGDGGNAEEANREDEIDDSDQQGNNKYHMVLRSGDGSRIGVAGMH